MGCGRVCKWIFGGRGILDRFSDEGKIFRGMEIGIEG